VDNVWLSFFMKSIKGKLVKSPYMTDQQKIELAWNDMYIAVHSRDLKRIFKLAFWIKNLKLKNDIEA